MPISRDQHDTILRILGPIIRRLQNSAARITVEVVNDATMQQLLQVTALEGETIEDGEHFQAYGFTARPLPGAEGVCLFPNGDRGTPLVVVVSDRRYRPTDALPGEVVVYNHTGAEIRMTALGDVVVTPAPGREIFLGSTSASDRVARASDLDALSTAIQGAVDGAGYGAALKAALTTAGWPNVTSRVKAE